MKTAKGEEKAKIPSLSQGHINKKCPQNPGATNKCPVAFECWFRNVNDKTNEIYEEMI